MNPELKNYRKKPLTIKAFKTEELLYVDTLEGTMTANPGDYIVFGIEGEMYPVKASIFEKTYEPVT